MNHPYNWTRFYRALCQHGPDLLIGVDEDILEVIRMSSQSTDMFWSDGLEELLRMGAVDGDMRAGVLSALDVWRENVLDALESSYGIELDWEVVSIDIESPLIDDLVGAALPDKTAPPH
jgi:hypothetical protein